MLERLARTCYRRRRLVLLAWIVVLLGMGFAGQRFGGEFNVNFNLPDSEAQEAFDLLEGRFAAQAGDSGQIVFTSERGVADEAVRGPLEELFADVRGLDEVGAVDSPYDGQGRAALSQDGSVGFATVRFDRFGPELSDEAVRAVNERVRATEILDGTVVLGGDAARFATQEQELNREWIGLVAAVFILLVTFGSVIAMGLPIMTAIFGLGIGIGIIQLFTHVIDVPDFTIQLAAMIGLGVGIDYALFIVTRYRQVLHGGADPEDAVVLAMITSGRAVVFAGITVVISLLGLFLIGLEFVRGLALGASTAVAITMLASVTLLPAVLGFSGRAIDRLHVPFLHRDESDHRSSFWFRWSRIVQRRPWPAAVAATLILLVLTIPLFSMRLGFTDAGNDPVGSNTRQAYDMLADGFGPGFNGPLLLVAELGDPSQRAGLTSLAGKLNRIEGVALSLPPQLSPGGEVAVITVIPTTSPQDAETQALIQRLRDEVIPAEVPGEPDVFVGGFTAAFTDMSDFLAGRLPYFIAAVVGLSFLLLMFVFRSLLIPLKAAVVNLLGIGAAYGVIVAIFQWGWLAGLVGVERTGPIEPFLPMMLFAILFGLSMDYEVFLMSRIREEYLHTKQNDIAVADGLAATARVITAAAAIMVTLFLSFVLGDQRVIKLFGLGLAVAIFLDATLIRMVAVPSIMELAGRANWWLPGWLERRLPQVTVEGDLEELEALAAEAARPEASATKKARPPKPQSKRKPAGREKPPARKSASKAKAGSGRKSTSAGKEPAARKATSTRKEPAARKATSTRKKPAARKATSTRKKPAARKKSTTRRSPRRS